MSLIKGRQCSESAFEYLNIELVHSYARQSQIPSAAAIEAIGACGLAIRRTVQLSSAPTTVWCRSLNAARQQSTCRPGYRVGRQLIEKYMFNRPQLKDSLDIIRFICKEFWGDLFKKQVPLSCMPSEMYSAISLIQGKYKGQHASTVPALPSQHANIVCFVVYVCHTSTKLTLPAA